MRVRVSMQRTLVQLNVWLIKHPMFLLDTIDNLAIADINATAKHMVGSDGRLTRLYSNL